MPISDPEFGIAVDAQRLLFETLEKLPKLNPIEGRMVLYDVMETHYGIFNHLTHGAQRPLSSVAFHPSEDFNTGSLLEERIRMYVRKGIGSIYRLNPFEFLDLPSDIIEMLLTISDEEQTRKTRMVNLIESEMEDLGKT